MVKKGIKIVTKDPRIKGRIRDISIINNENVGFFVYKWLINYNIIDRSIFSIYCYNGNDYKDGYIKIKRFKRIIEFGIVENYTYFYETDDGWGTDPIKVILKLTKLEYYEILRILSKEG